MSKNSNRVCENEKSEEEKTSFMKNSIKNETLLEIFKTEIEKIIGEDSPRTATAKISELFYSIIHIPGFAFVSTAL